MPAETNGNPFWRKILSSTSQMIFQIQCPKHNQIHEEIKQHEEEPVGKTDNGSGPPGTPDCAPPPTRDTDPKTTILTMFMERKAELEN